MFWYITTQRNEKERKERQRNREAMKSRERLWRYGERNRKRERWSWDTEKEEIASLFLSLRSEFIHHFDFTRERSRRRKIISISASRTKKVPSAHKQHLWWVLFFFWFFLGKLDLLYAFNFSNLVLDLDSKIRAKEIRF